MCLCVCACVCVCVFVAHQFPLSNLDMAPFVTTPSTAGSIMYDLVSVVCHHGRGVDTGHYTAYCRDAERGTVSVLSVPRCDCVCACALVRCWSCAFCAGVCVCTCA